MSKLLKLRDYYLEYAKENEHRCRVNSAKMIIDNALSRFNNHYISYSTGKDSLCLLRLVHDIDKKIDVMYHDSGVELPESEDVLNKAIEVLNFNVNIVNSPVNVIEIYNQKRAIIDGGCKDYAWSLAMKKPILEWSNRNLKNAAFIGIRGEESKRRRYMLKRNGYDFYCKYSGIQHIYPLYNWKGKDVFAYIFSNGLDELIHPAYYKDKFHDNPEKIRVSWYCDPTCITHGSAVWLKYYYPEIFREIDCFFPELKSYC